MKMILTAPAVARLLELDPGGTVEIAKTAASLVANEIANRMTREILTRRIDAFVDAELSNPQEWGKTKFAAKYRKAIEGALKDYVNEFFLAVSNGEIKKMILVLVADAIKAMRPEMEAQADQILRERFVAMFTLPPPSSGAGCSRT